MKIYIRKEKKKIIIENWEQLLKLAPSMCLIMNISILQSWILFLTLKKSQAFHFFIPYLEAGIFFCFKKIFNLFLKILEWTTF